MSEIKEHSQPLENTPHLHLLQQLRSWSEQGWIRTLDYQLACLMAEQSAQPALVLLAALVSSELASGHVCLPLSKLQTPQDYWSEEIANAVAKVSWSQLQPESSCLGTGDLPVLLVQDQSRFYLYRYWRYEIGIARELQKRAEPVAVDQSLLQKGLAELFGPSSEETDWQQVAAALAVQKRFAVISGGPGTGKTTTVIKLLALYLQQTQAQGRAAHICLAAPTGKAAARLAESISSAKQKLSLPAELADKIPAEASTLHRLLGVIPRSLRFRHNAANPLHLDLLVLDEASMVDLPMMARLLEALPSHARLILLGDRDQLASVEAGSVLGDICSWPGELGYSEQQSQQLSELCQLLQPLKPHADTGFADCLALLRKSYRFDDASGIGFLARAVNAGDAAEAMAVLTQNYSDLDYQPLSRDSYELLIQQVVTFHRGLLDALNKGASPRQLLAGLAQLQLLCALRKGPYGVEGLNERILKELSSRGLVDAGHSWYPGRPVIVTRNDPGLGIFNGDVGICVPDAEGRLKVWFEQHGEMRSILPSRLPEHETVYAMTVHKSQGSEFDQVLLIMPPDDSPLLSRELLYTGITRARKTLSLFATDMVLRRSTGRCTERAGGLALRLWRNNAS